MTSQKSSEQWLEIVGRFSTQQAAREAEIAIQSAGFSPEQLSVEMQNFMPRTEISDTQAGKSAKGGAIAGAILGGLFGFLLSIVIANLPDVGPLASVHPNAFTFGVTLAGGIVGAAGFGAIGALSGVSVPKEPEKVGDRASSQNYTIIVRGTPENIARAREILQQQGGQI
jgi:hypothetical protein